MITEKTDQILAELLLRKGIISQDTLTNIGGKVDNDRSLLEVLVSDGLVDTSVITELVGHQDFSFIDLNECNINPSVLELLPEVFARRYHAIPIEMQGQVLVVAMADPLNVLAIDDLHMVTGHSIKAVAALESEILSTINHYYKTSDLIKDEAANLDSAEKDVTISNLKAVSEEAPIIKLLNMLIVKAINERVSDIHIEPQEKDLRVRYRIDGVLKEVMRSPKHIQAGIISRLKIMAGLDIAETRVPQDGHCDLNVSGNVVDFRVATLPTIYGERVVLRILRKESILLNLDDLGFLPDSLIKFKNAFNKPYGAVLVTGPTGSGKSTTLYAALNILNNKDTNIITVEDPVEYRLPGVNQVQVNTKAGLTFAKVLKAVLRASPDIVMVGEIRDKETAQIATEAALTGHLVLSTLHTNDAPGAVSRLTEMGIAPFLISSAIECILAQRLARRLCSNCKEEYEPPLESLERAGLPVDGNSRFTLYRPKGCPRCNGTGYKGRIGVYEIMPFSEGIEELCVKRATTEEIKQVAIAEGMKTLRQDGFEKVKLGVTSLEEIMRIIV